MLYALLGDAVIVLHALWVLFLIIGLFLAMRFPRLAWMHLGGLVFTLGLNLGGWFCPLTYLENYLYRLHDPTSVYSGSFLSRYLQTIIYLDVPEAYLRIGAMLWVIMNLAGYGILIRGRKIRRWQA